MSDNSTEMLRELFWRSSLRVAVMDLQGRIILTSKSFRDSFPDMIRVHADSYEVLIIGNKDRSESFFRRLASLPPGERFSFSLRMPFAGEESLVDIVTAALFNKLEDCPLFLTEWIPVGSRKEVSRALDEIEYKYRNLQENLPVGIYRAGEDGILKTANSTLVRMMGFTSFEELQNVRLKDVWVDPGQRSGMIERLRRDGSVLNYEVNLKRKNGDILIASFDARGTFDAYGRLIYFDTIVQDITQSTQAKNELVRLSRTDSLTGLFNRQYLFEKLEEEIGRARRYQRPLSVMLIDLDFFKAVNDEHGHLAGDAILVSAAFEISRILRDTDFAGRYGGEEFCVVMPESGIEGAENLAERLRATMERTEHQLPDGNTLHVTCSIGVTEASSGSVEDIIALADIALYEAKRSGRNRVERKLGSGLMNTDES